MLRDRINGFENCATLRNVTMGVAQASNYQILINRTDFVMIIHGFHDTNTEDLSAQHMNVKTLASMMFEGLKKINSVLLQQRVSNIILASRIQEAKQRCMKGLRIENVDCLDDCLVCESHNIIQDFNLLVDQLDSVNRPECK